MRYNSHGQSKGFISSFWFTTIQSKSPWSSDHIRRLDVLTRWSTDMSCSGSSRVLFGSGDPGDSKGTQRSKLISRVLSQLTDQGLLQYPRQRHWLTDWIYGSPLLQLVLSRVQLALCPKLDIIRDCIDTTDGGLCHCMAVPFEQKSRVSLQVPLSREWVYACVPSGRCVLGCVEQSE